MSSMTSTITCKSSDETFIQMDISKKIGNHQELLGVIQTTLLRMKPGDKVIFEVEKAKDSEE